VGDNVYYFVKHIILLISILAVSTGTLASHKVYLIHGFGGTGVELKKIERAIEKAGYSTKNYKYASLQHDIDLIAKDLYDEITLNADDTVSFITHSMGALVVRALFQYINQDKNFPIVQRIVMLAPPNKGSPVADHLKQFKLIRTLAGPNLKNLTTDSITGSAKYPVPTTEVGLIIGTKSKSKKFTAPLKGENDGIVLVEDTSIGNEKDIFSIRASHTGLLFNKAVKKAVILFLQAGKFSNTLTQS
jgi:triacylglycerol lipase